VGKASKNKPKVLGQEQGEPKVKVGKDKWGGMGTGQYNNQCPTTCGGVSAPKCGVCVRHVSQMSTQGTTGKVCLSGVLQGVTGEGGEGKWARGINGVRGSKPTSKKHHNPTYKAGVQGSTGELPMFL